MESQRKFLDGTQKEKTGEEVEDDDFRVKGGFVAMQPA